MSRVLKVLFFAVVVKPLVFVVLGLNIRGKNNLPRKGPAIIAANHNSHLDALVLMSLFPLSIIHRVRPVAAADYFLKNRLRSWFSRNLIGIVPMERKDIRTQKEDLFTPCHDALNRQEILVLFPEGSRGKPEEMSTIKKGIYRIVKDRTDTTITPVVMHGLGRSLPRGEALLVPFNCDVIIGEQLPTTQNAKEFVEVLTKKFHELQEYCITRNDIDQI